ncbi:ABC transporter permease [Microvirga sp. 17 mud 1-3]|uniref:ABC transporter permease n=1 Tax=Microvirga sp. 17 mud 1-3 TaxID=2082949 RepID=UPI000D6C0F5F|nr:ABC transporter permease [Microvirga sp. 17 mud 1-3]AWM87685.1 ABC transporter [Microvirga sp. 17 mud 1-3]
MLSLPYRILWSNRQRIFALSVLELSSRYASSVLGALWIVVFPLFFLSIYAYVYLFVFKVQAANVDSLTLILIIFGALVPFISFQETLSVGAMTIVSNKPLVNGTLFPIEILPPRVALSSFPVLFVGLALVIVTRIFQGQASLTLLLLPVAIALQFLFLCGIAWLVSTMTVFFRDFGQIVGLLSVVLMLLSPIGYSREQVPDTLGWISLINPLFYMIEFYRDILIRGDIDPKIAVTWVITAFGTFHIGFFLFERLKLLFADYV